MCAGDQADGHLSPAHAQVLASLRHGIGAEALASAEPHLVAWASKSTPKDLRNVVRHVKHSYGREKVVRDEKDDYDARRLHASATIDGLGVGNSLLHPVGFETVMAAIHAASRPVSGDDRTAAQRRADALITIAEIALRSGALPITGGVKPHVTVTVTLPTITDQDLAPAADYAFGATSSVEWTRRIACDAEVARVVFAETGAVLDAGRAARLFTSGQYVVDRIPRTDPRWTGHPRAALARSGPTRYAKGLSHQTDAADLTPVGPILARSGRTTGRHSALTF